MCAFFVKENRSDFFSSGFFHRLCTNSDGETQLFMHNMHTTISLETWSFFYVESYELTSNKLFEDNFQPFSRFAGEMHCVRRYKLHFT